MPKQIYPLILIGCVALCVIIGHLLFTGTYQQGYMTGYEEGYREAYKDSTEECKKAILNLHREGKITVHPEEE